MDIKVGQVATVKYEDRDFEIVVIDPNGLGVGHPTIGFGLRMMERYSGVAHNTLSLWLKTDSDGSCYISAPSSEQYKLFRVVSTEGNEYAVLEVSDWVSLAVDLVKKPGKLKKPTKYKLADFLGWFAVKGLYASAYVELKDKYSKKDDRVLSSWMNVRLSGMRQRKEYTDFLQAKGCLGKDFAKWTDWIYRALFGMSARDMRRCWDVVEGKESIARNHISEEKGLEAVAFCEAQVVQLYIDDLMQAHRDAVYFARRKYLTQPLTLSS